MFGTILLLGAALAVDPEFRVVTDFSAAPELSAYAARATAICEEWYPKINARLYGEGHPFYYREVRIVLEPGDPKPARGGGVTVAWAHRGVIHFHAGWLKGNPPDFDTVIAHELTHVVTDNYALRIARCDGIHAIPCFFQIHFSRPNRGVDWTQEAIMDYITFTFFTQRLQPRLRLDANRRLTGYDRSVPYFYGLQEAKVPIGDRDYRLSYSVGAAFLYWMEQKKNPDVVRLLNTALTEQRASPKLIRKITGQTVDELWREFLRQQ